jgi:outer membrane biosynthesis protein TonB
MASYDRLGSFLLADALATVPSGRIYRAISVTGATFERHHFLCTFSDELLEAGLAAHGSEIQQAVDRLGTLRGFGGNYRFEAGKPVLLVCDYVPGRCLAQVLEKTRDEQVPLGVDHALTVLQSLAQCVILMHDKGLRHGSLSPNSVWISFEGAVQILDAPLGAVIQALLPKAPALKAALEPYRRTKDANAFQQDLFSVGAIFYELLTLEKLPAGAAIPEALDRATLKAAQEEGPIPEEILNLLKRLLMVGQPFAGAPEFNATLERVLYDGEYSPTTFNMAFLMHTLFREENEAEAQAMKLDQAANFAQYLPPPGAQGGAPKARSSRALYYLLAVGALVVIALFGGLYYQSSLSNRERANELKSVQAKLAAFQRDKEAAEEKLADITKQEEAQKALEDMFGKQAEEATTQEAKANAQKELETIRQKTKELARQRAEAVKERQRLAQQAQTMNVPAAPVQPPPAAAPASALAPPPGPGQDSQPTVTHQGSPLIPRVARESLPPALQDSEIKVALKVFVNAAGRPLKVVILKGGTPEFNEAAQNAALASTYAPGTRNGKPASGWLNMEFNFGKPR